MNSLFPLIAEIASIYFSARMMKNAGKSWGVGAVIGFCLNIFGPLLVLFITKRVPQGKKNEKFAIEQFNKLLGNIKHSQASFKGDLETIKNASSKDLQNQLLLTFDTVELREVRAGTVVAETKGTMSGKTRSGSIGISGKHVGITATSGSFSGTMRSTTITPPAPESLQPIDIGRILIRQDMIAFVGNKYSKSIEYKDIVDWVSNGAHNPFPYGCQITLSVKGSDKAIVFAIPLRSEGDFLDKLLTEVVSSKSQHLDAILVNQMMSWVENYVDSREQDIRSIQNSLESNLEITDKWKNYVVRGEITKN